MARSTTFRFDYNDQTYSEIDLSDFHTIQIHFRFPDGAKLISFQGFHETVSLPPDASKDFLHWLAEI